MVDFNRLLKKRRDMAKQKQEAEVASLNPSEMLAGGLKDDFRGRIIEAVYAPWDYDGSIDEPVLAARLTIQELDEDGEEITEGDDEGKFVQHWSAGDLAAFAPSQDGKTPCEDDEVGPFALRVGKRAQLNNNTNFAHLLTSILDSGTAAKKFTVKDLTASLECLEGLDCHWNRVPQKKRSGLADAEEGETRRARDVLVVTEVYGYGEESGGGKKSKPNGKAGKPTSAKSKAKDEDVDDEPEADDADDLDTEMQEVVKEALPTKKGKLPQLMMSAFATDKKKKAAAVKRCTEADFLEGGPWNYDEDTGKLTEED